MELHLTWCVGLKLRAGPGMEAVAGHIGKRSCLIGNTAPFASTEVSVLG